MAVTHVEPILLTKAPEGGPQSYDEYVAGCVLVVALGAARDGEQELRTCEARRRLALLEADVRDMDPSGVKAARGDDEPDLAPVKGDGLLRGHDRAGDLARRCVDA